MGSEANPLEDVHWVLKRTEFQSAQLQANDTFP